MFQVVLYFIANIVTILGLSAILPNFEVTGITAAFMFVFFLTLLNFTVIPIIKFLTFPINFLTLGLFHALINILTIGIVANSIKSVELRGDGLDKFFTSIIIALSLSVVHTLISKTNK
jgi:putative membrane protein